MLVRILHIEDSAADAELVADTFDLLGAKVTLVTAEHGDAALELLRARGTPGSEPQFDLILLDLNLPRKNGHHLLEALKLDPRLKGVPAIVLTTSRAEHDIRQAYQLGASAYLVKPGDLAGMREVVGAIKAFWVDIVQFPVAPEPKPH